MKKSAVLIVVLIFTASASLLYGQGLGNVNSDQVVDIVDALLVAQYYVGITPAVFYTTHADANMNGTIDIIDALLIARYYVGLIDNFPVYEYPVDPGYRVLTLTVIDETT